MFGVINVLTLLICIDALLAIILCVKAVSYISYKRHKKKYERKIAKCNMVVYARRDDVKVTYESAEDRDGDLWPYGTYTASYSWTLGYEKYTVKLQYASFAVSEDFPEFVKIRYDCDDPDSYVVERDNFVEDWKRNCDVIMDRKSGVVQYMDIK